MPGAGLLERAKSLQLKKPNPQATDLGEPDMVDSQFSDARSFKNQHRYRPIQEQFTSPNSRPLPPHPDLAKRDVGTGHDRHEYGQNDTSSIVSSSTAGHNATPEDLIIGLALGSPRENPLPPIPPDSVREDVSSVSSSLNSPTAVREHKRSDLALQKGRRWRTFTGLFNRKDASSPFYLLGQNSPRRDLPYQCTYHKKAPEQFVSQQQVRSTHRNRERERSSRLPQGLDRQLPPIPRRGIFRGGEVGLRRQIGWRNTRFRKEHRRDGRNPTVNKSRSWPLHILREKVRPPPKNGATACSPSSSKLKDDSLLQVEIPSVHMERYSVMFSNLLESAQPNSILARRQGTLSEIKLEANDRDKTKSIRATRAKSDETKSVPVQVLPCVQDVAPPKSGQPTVSNSSSFLSSHPEATVPLERSTLHCGLAITTSSLSIEPKLKTSKSHERNCVLFLDSSPDETPGEEVTSNGPVSTLDLDRCHSPIAGKDLELLDCGKSAEKFLTPLPLNPGVRKPPTPSRHHERNSLICRHSQVKPMEKTISDAPEISTARQISVSRRQRQVVPIVSKQARQPKQPKLVIDGDQHAPSRKSHYLTVENA